MNLPFIPNHTDVRQRILDECAQHGHEATDAHTNFPDTGINAETKREIVTALALNYGVEIGADEDTLDNIHSPNDLAARIHKKCVDAFEPGSLDDSLVGLASTGNKVAPSLLLPTDVTQPVKGKLWLPYGQE